MKAPQMKAKKFKPGGTVPTDGIYRVFHDSHRLMHESALLAGDLFPKCKKCKMEVRFQLFRPIHGRRVLPFRSSLILEEFEERKPGFRMIR
ncbi:MAG TPA: hypothetical protein VKE71_13180 [Candidatus Angelobacter sp.]|nr:hypothetical protein [Candidatus Angelobacter sp.]